MIFEIPEGVKLHFSEIQKYMFRIIRAQFAWNRFACSRRQEHLDT